jgi:hypothetical protein
MRTCAAGPRAMLGFCSVGPQACRFKAAPQALLASAVSAR